MNDAEERFVRWYAHLPPDAPLDRHAARVLLRRALANREALAEYLLKQECAPALLGEFIYRHWNDAISDAPSSAALRLASAVMRALGRIDDEDDRRAAEWWFRLGLVPSARVLRQLCKGINDAGARQRSL
jgi:hypothetical protein